MSDIEDTPKNEIHTVLSLEREPKEDFIARLSRVVMTRVEQQAATHPMGEYHVTWLIRNRKDFISIFSQAFGCCLEKRNHLNSGLFSIHFENTRHSLLLLSLHGYFESGNALKDKEGVAKLTIAGLYSGTLDTSIPGIVPKIPDYAVCTPIGNFQRNIRTTPFKLRFFEQISSQKLGLNPLTLNRIPMHNVLLVDGILLATEDNADTLYWLNPVATLCAKAQKNSPKSILQGVQEAFAKDSRTEVLRDFFGFDHNGVLDFGNPDVMKKIMRISLAQKREGQERE